MSGNIKIDREGEIDYAKPLPRALLRDSRLSFGARGLFAFLWDLPRGWTIRLIHLIRMAPEGRDALRSRLHELEEVGAIRIEPIRVEGGRVAGKRWILVAPDRWAIEAPLQDDSTEERVFRFSADPIIENPATKVLQGSKVLQEEAAAPRANARGTDSAAASSKGSNAKRQHPDRSRLGIECWYPGEDLEADAIVAVHDSDAITAAVAAIKQRLNGAGNNTSPVPALVLAELKRQQRKRDAAVSPELRLGASANSKIDPTAQNVGLQLLSATLRAKHHQTTNTKEAAA